jgi:periplasmic divalent cation tolerance protein
VSSAKPSDALIVFMTVPDVDVGAAIARVLVDERLAACVNILPGIRSIYRWQGQVSDEGEVLCLIKTRAALYDRLRERATALHPYQVPELLAVSPAAGNEPYLRWIADSVID